MLSKKEFCECIVKNELGQFMMPPKREEAHEYIYQSSNLAVALEFLGELDEVEKEYSSSRAGIVETYPIFDDEGNYVTTAFLTMRELIELLPDFVSHKADNI